MPSRAHFAVAHSWVALVCVLSAGCGGGEEDIMGPCPDCAIQTVDMANQAMENALSAIKAGRHPEELAAFAYLREIVGFPEYYEAEIKYASD